MDGEQEVIFARAYHVGGAQNPTQDMIFPCYCCSIMSGGLVDTASACFALADFESEYGQVSPRSMISKSLAEVMIYMIYISGHAAWRVIFDQRVIVSIT